MSSRSGSSSSSSSSSSGSDSEGVELERVNISENKQGSTRLIATENGSSSPREEKPSVEKRPSVEKLPLAQQGAEDGPRQIEPSGSKSALRASVDRSASEKRSVTVVAPPNGDATRASVDGNRPSVDARRSVDMRRSVDGRRSTDGRASVDRRPRPSMDRQPRPSLDKRPRDSSLPSEAKKTKEEEEAEAEDDFVPSVGLTTEEATELLAEYGRNELEDKTTPKWLVFLQQLYGPMPIMIWIAIVIEAAIQNWIDFGILWGIQLINATIGWYETTKAGDAVAALKASLKPIATVKRDGVWQQIDAALVVPGDLVMLGAGSAVPADCIVNEGRIEVDQSALTGESLPVTMTKGDSPKMGSNITRGETEASVQFTGKNTFFGKTASMLQVKNELGNLQMILFKIMIVLVILSITLCVVCLIYLPVHKKVEFTHALSFVIVLLVASIPIAIEIVTTTTLAVGSRKLSAMHAIVTRLVSIEEMAGMDMLCSDKTGTLTLNKMVIQDEVACPAPGETRDSVLQSAALAAKWKEPPRDALDTMVLGSADLKACDAYTQLDYTPFDATIKRTEAKLRGPDGRVFRIAKGAPNIILNMCHNKEEIRASVEDQILSLGKRGIRCLSVARTYVRDDDTNEAWELLGILTFLDPPRPDTKRTIERAIEYGVAVKMITGDHQVIAIETAKMLGMGANIKDSHGLPEMDGEGKPPKDLVEKYGQMIREADGFAHVYPEHKFLIVECLRQQGFKCGMTGDGVNDAPALKRADVGIAVSGATDAARAAADIVLTSPGLSVVVEAIIIARCIFQRVQNFINYRIAATLQLLCFFFISVFAFPPSDYDPSWPEFFQLPVLLLMLITLLNDGTLITIGYDTVRPSQNPEKWNLKLLFTVSIVLAAVACGSSLLLLWCALDSNNPHGVFQAGFGLPPMEYSEIVMMIYMKVSISDFLTLFSARTRSFFFTARPGPLLLGGGAFALSLSTILACTWPPQILDSVPISGLAVTAHYHTWPLWIWIYCIIWWFIQDTLKVLTYIVVYKFHIFGAHEANLMAAANPEKEAAKAAKAHIEAQKKGDNQV